MFNSKAERFKRGFEGIGNWLAISVFNILAYVFSQEKRIMESTSKLCRPYEDSWLLPQQVSRIDYSDVFAVLFCRHMLCAQIFAAFTMILVIAYLIFYRLSCGKHTMLILYLGIVCGLPGKFSVELLGGNGKLWLFVWTTFCVLQLLVDVASMCGLTYGPRNLTGGTKLSSMVVPCWASRCFFLVQILLALPLMYAGL